MFVKQFRGGCFDNTAACASNAAEWNVYVRPDGLPAVLCMVDMCGYMIRNRNGIEIQILDLKPFGSFSASRRC